MHSFAGPEETSQKACLRAGETAARSSVLSAGCIAAISRYATPSLDPSVHLNSTLLAGAGLIDVCVLPGPAHCGINATTRVQRKTAFLDREAWSQDTFR